MLGPETDTNTQADADWKECPMCGDDVHIERWNLGGRYQCCKACGDNVAEAERKGWTIIQEYGKGGYMYVSPESAHNTLRNTNQKQTRGETA